MAPLVGRLRVRIPLGVFMGQLRGFQFLLPHLLWGRYASGQSYSVAGKQRQFFSVASRRASAWIDDCFDGPSGSWVRIPLAPPSVGYKLTPSEDLP